VPLGFFWPEIPSTLCFKASMMLTTLPADCGAGYDGTVPAARLQTRVDASCNEFIMKPFTSQELLEKIKALIQ
jgi:hypothetical protein